MKMKLKTIFLFLLLFILMINTSVGLIFMKKLSDPRYPGVCFPIHSRVGRRKKWTTIYLKPGEEHQDENVCGTQKCLNANGDVMIYYCPKPIPMINCHYEQVNTRVKFPECCWNCVAQAKCAPQMIFPPYPYPPRHPVPPLKHFP